MRVFDGEQQMMADLKDEGRVIEEKDYPSFRLALVRHPTLGKLVLIEGRDGRGAVVEVDD